jgi:hypothetical protein
LRLRLEQPTTNPAHSEVELRFKLRIPSAALEAGAETVEALAAGTAAAFESLLGDADIRRFVATD